MICKNCKNKLNGDFCSSCGQKSRTDRISFSYLLKEIPESIFQLNRGFFFTVKELLVRPGHTIRDFLSGKRVYHYKPLAFLLVATSIYVLAHYFLEKNTFLYDLALGWEERAEEQNMGANNEFVNWVSKYQVYVPLFFLPIYTISTYLAFYRSKYNYLEHLVINFYITGQQMLIYWILGYLFLKENAFLTFPIIVGMVYNSWALFQLFDTKKTWTKFGLIFLSYIIFIVELFLIGFVLGSVKTLSS